MLIKKNKPIRSPKHLAWVRTLKCVVTGDEISVVCAHVRKGLGGGMACKPCDGMVLPLRADMHTLQHQIGEDKFWGRWGIDPVALAKQFAAQSPCRKVRGAYAKNK